jgi:biotin transport system substrate-specific component
VQTSLVANLWPQARTSWLGKIALVILGTALLTLSAKIKVPFYPVPMTMQVFAVLALSLALGFRLGLAAVLLYLVEGAANLPVFAGTPERGLGIAYMMGPTGGYLLGYVFAAAAVGWLADQGWGRYWAKAILAAYVGLMLIYVPGLLWLGTIIGWSGVLQNGFTPFILGDLAKMLVAALAVAGVWQITNSQAARLE